MIKERAVVGKEGTILQFYCDHLVNNKTLEGVKLYCYLNPEVLFVTYFCIILQFHGAHLFKNQLREL